MDSSSPLISPVIPDVYEDDCDGRPNIGAMVAAGYPWCGLGMKATEGIYYPQNPDWFQNVWPAARLAAGVRYGIDFFRYAYHYFIVGEDPVRQADLALGLVDSAGGWGDGDWPLVVDVEAAEQPNASAQQVIDGVSNFTARILSKTGKQPILYAGAFIRDLKITDHMGCQLLITAAYGSTLPARLYLDMGWTLSELLGWQYSGAGNGYTGPKGYPQTSPLCEGEMDLTAITIENGASPEAQLVALRKLCLS